MSESLQRIEEFQLAALTEFPKQGLRRAPAHRPKRVETGGGVAIERFFEQASASSGR